MNVRDWIGITVSVFYVVAMFIAALWLHMPWWIFAVTSVGIAVYVAWVILEVRGRKGRNARR